MLAPSIGCCSHGARAALRPCQPHSSPWPRPAATAGSPSQVPPEAGLGQLSGRNLSPGGRRGPGTGCPEELEVPLPYGGGPKPGCMGLGAGTRWVLSSLPTSPIPQRCDGDKGGYQRAGTPSISSPNHQWRAGLGWKRAASSFLSQAPTKASSPEASRQGRLRTCCLEEAAPFATARAAAAELIATPAARRTRAAQARGVDALQLLESHSSLLRVL